MVIGEGFVNHQEHDAGEESEGQADKNGDLRKTEVSVTESQLMRFQATHAAFSTWSQEAVWYIGKGQAPRELAVSWLDKDT